MASFSSKVKSLAKKIKQSVANYGKNVAGGAKIVAEGVKKAANYAKDSFSQAKSGDSRTSSNTAGLFGTGGDTTSSLGVTVPTTKKISETLVSEGLKNTSFFGVPVTTSAGSKRSLGATGSWEPQSTPRTISSGKQSTSGSSVGTNSLMASPYQAPTILSSASFGGSSGTDSISSTGGGTTAVTLPSAPGSTNPQVDNTALAGTLSPFYQRNADGTFTQVEEKVEPTVDDKVKDRAKLLENYLGVKESVYDDREVRRAQREQKRLKEALQAPTAELNAIINQNKADVLAFRKAGAANNATKADFSQFEAAANYNAAIRALSLQASIASLQGELELAQDYLQELVTVKTDQINRQYEYRKQVFASIEGILDEEDKRAYEEQKTANDRAYEEEKDLIKTQFELSQMVMQNAPESVRTNIINRINAAPNKMAALQAAGGYAVPSNTQITTLDNGDTVVIDKNTGRIISNVGGRAVTTDSAGTVNGISAVTGKPKTDAERKASGFAERLVEADTIIDQVGSQFSNAGSYFSKFTPNILKSEDRQLFEQAKRNFVNAILRRESGAVISDEEFANADKQYFPQPGDTAAVMKQKDANRATVIENLKLEGGIINQNDNKAPAVILQGKTSSGIGYKVLQ